MITRLGGPWLHTLGGEQTQGVLVNQAELEHLERSVSESRAFIAEVLADCRHLPAAGFKLAMERLDEKLRGASKV